MKRRFFQNEASDKTINVWVVSILSICLLYFSNFPLFNSLCANLTKFQTHSNNSPAAVDELFECV